MSEHVGAVGCIEQKGPRWRIHGDRIPGSHLVADIGGASLLSALMFLQSPSAAVIVIDPESERIAKPILTCLHAGESDRVPQLLNDLNIYDKISDEVMDLVRLAYAYQWQRVSRHDSIGERLVAIPARVNDVRIDGRRPDIVACNFPNPMNMPPFDMIRGGLKLLGSGGSLQILTENSDYFMIAQELLQEKTFGPLVWQAEVVEQLPFSVPSSLYDIIVRGQQRYLIDIKKR